MTLPLMTLPVNDVAGQSVLTAGADPAGPHAHGLAGHFEGASARSGMLTCENAGHE